MHVVDLDGARDGTQPNREIIVELARQRRLRLQVGGGLRTLERVRDLLDAGVERAVIGSVAVTAPDEVAQLDAQVDPNGSCSRSTCASMTPGTPMRDDARLAEDQRR